MIWDFAEPNPFSDSGAGDYTQSILRQPLQCALEGTPANGKAGSVADQLDATALSDTNASRMFCTVPPYYDNIGYADLSDFFYVMAAPISVGPHLRPDICSTLLVPKAQELVATPYRFDGSRERAHEFFEEGFGKAFDQIKAARRPGLPILQMTVYYAFQTV